jgi:bacteriocin-like protein
VNNRRIDSKSGAIELNDEQLKSVTGGRKAGSDHPYLVITMKEVLISSVTHGSSHD